MLFGGKQNRANWGVLLKNDVFGPFAPRSGWIEKNNSDYKGKSIKKKGVKKGISSTMIDKKFRKNSIAKNFMKVFKHQVDEIIQDTIKEPNVKKRRTQGQLCDIFCGTKVKYIELLETSSKTMLRISYRHTSFIRFWKWN